MAKMVEDPRRSAERRRALELLAASPDGCTAAILMAHGFKSDRLVELINAGLASVTTERVIAGDRRWRLPACGSRTPAGRRWIDPRRGDDCDHVLTDPQACGGEPYLR